MALQRNRFIGCTCCYSKEKSPHDLRGTHVKPNVIPGEICQKISNHINSFPKKSTHYSGRELEYLHGRLDVKTMHHLFIKENPELNVEHKFYLQYFNQNFNLRFGRPQVNTCTTCEELSAKIRS